MEEILPETTPEITEVSETFFTLKSPILSPNSSPSHEFPFTISLNSTKTTPTSPTLSTKSNESQFPSAIDLTPADDIFFHGHLLPLHFLSHFHPTSSSPRSSTTSIDNSFQIPAKEKRHENKPDDNFCEDVMDKRKSKVFSLSGFTKWVKGSESKEKPDKTRKLKFDMGQFLKRYVKMVKPRLSSKGGDYEGQRKSYSFSGSLSPRIDRRELRDLRDGFSASASMRTSPTNSGLILAKAGAPSPVNDSTMEELHSAIQAAIAHCKNSTSLKNKSHDFCSPSVPVN